MSILSSYLSSRKQRHILELLESHVGRCKAVGHTLGKIADDWYQGETESAKINKRVIETEEKSADHLERQIIKEVGKSAIPGDTMKEDLINFVRLLDTAAGGAKRAGLNILLLMDYPLPEKYAQIFAESSKLVSQIFAKIEGAISQLDNTETIRQITQEVDKLEDQMDGNYSQLKTGYFEIEKSFESAAALIILDHIARDFEYAADMGEDAMDLLLELVQRRS
jgi:predicted phosphate transport protein (TIGR00153 family)